jgi:hypothetical protein
MQVNELWLFSEKGSNAMSNVVDGKSADSVDLPDFLFNYGMKPMRSIENLRNLECFPCS